MVASTCGDPRKTMFFFLEPPPATEADLAAQQKKRRSNGWEYRAMAGFRRASWIGMAGW
jgi:hypothetical protein